jgi:N-acetyl sugar amidotransferase
LPNDVIFCKRCVISNQRPSSSVEFLNVNGPKKTINIDADGICDACKYNEFKQQVDWESRSQQFLRILERYRKNDGSYDCVVPSSGGKDSSFTAHKLKNKYGMNPLTVTWAPAMFTEIGRSNFDNLGSVGGIDNILFTPSERVHSMLTRNAFLKLGHPFQPFIHGQKIIGPRIASQLGIPLVVYGENQAEYGNSIDENNDFLMDPSFYSSERPEEIVLGGYSIKEYISEYGHNLSDFAAYMPLSGHELERTNTKTST